MPNAIKYNVSAETLALKKGNFWIGTGDVGKGPTSSTGFYNGLTPPTGGYTIYLNKATGGPSIYTVTTEAQMVSLTNSIGSQSFTTSGQCLNWFATQTDKMIFNIDYPAIITDSLLWCVDAGFTPSYSTTGTTWYDISGNGKNGTLINGTSYNSSYSGSLVFDGVDDYAYFSNISSTFPPQGTVSFWMWADVVENYRNPLQFTNINGSNVGIRFEEYTPGDQFHGGFNALFGNNSNFTGYRYLPYPGVLTANAWYNVVLAWNTSTSNIVGYLNNDLKFNANDAIYAPTNINNLVVGTGFSMDRCWKGRISGVMIYTKQLSSTEVSQNYNAQKGRFGL
jgi:hypothetical protein